MTGRKYTSRPPAAAGEEEAGPREYPFELDEATFTAVLDAADADAVLEWSELAATATAANAELTSPEGVAFTARFFRLMLPGAEYARFRAHLKAHHTHPDTLLEIMAGLNEDMAEAVEDEAGRPIAPSPPSLPGRGARDERRLQIISMAGGDADIEFADYSEPPVRPRPRQTAPRQPRDHRRRQDRRRTG